MYVNTSAPAPPVIVSAPNDPSIISAPLPPLIVSPSIVVPDNLASVPVIVSPPIPPVIVIPESSSGDASNVNALTRPPALIVPV